MELSTREKVLIAIMLVLAVGLFGYFGVQQLESYTSQLNTQLTARQRQLGHLENLEQEWLRLSAHPNLPVIKEPLSSFLESGARRIGLQEQLQLNPLSNAPEGTEGVQVRLDRINLDQMFDMLYFLENNKPVVLVEQMEVTTSPGSKLIRISFRVYKQNNG